VGLCWQLDNSVIHEMEGKNWSILFENKTVNENYSNFLSILNEACDKHIPTKTVVIRSFIYRFLMFMWSFKIINLGSVELYPAAMAIRYYWSN
jgi:hypothetical protein